MFNLPDLPYSYSALEPYIDEATMRIHHDKHHATYVENLNKTLSGQEKFLNLPIDKLLQNLNLVPEEIKIKVRNNAGGHANHSLFWKIMHPAKEVSGEPQGELLTVINSAFGNFKKFKEKFSQVAFNHFGSGWAWLTHHNSKLLIIDTLNQDSPLMDTERYGMPILGLDVWEHAYYLKYQNRRIEYIQAWWNVVNWREVERQFKKAVKP